MKQLLLLCCCLLSLEALSAERSKQEMATIARVQLNSLAAARRAGTTNADEDIRLLKSSATYSIFGSSKTEGFVVVSRDDAFQPVIGCSEQRFDEQSMPEGLRWWLTEIDSSLAWRLANGQYAAMADFTPVDNFIATTWGQESPYNSLCPSTASGVQSPAGCLAVAMAQVLKYYEYPASSTGTSTYTSTSERSVALNTAFDWQNMLMDYANQAATDDQQRAVAELMRDCGYVCKTEYKYNYSGARFHSAAYGLITNLGFDSNYLVLADKEGYSDEEWNAIIYRELSARRPIIFGGQDRSKGGHAYVLSGVNSQGLIWVNWGWEGEANGWFDIADLTVRAHNTSFSFNSGWQMIFNLHPYPGTDGIRPMPKSDFCMYDFTSNAPSTYELTVSGMKVKTKIAYPVFPTNYHYLPFRGVMVLRVIDDDTRQVANIDMLSVNQEVKVLYATNFDISADLSTLPNGRYTVYVASKAEGDNLYAPIRCYGGPIAYSLSKTDNGLALSTPFTFIPSYDTDDVPMGISSPMKAADDAPMYFDVMGRQRRQPAKGLNIIRRSDGKTSKVVTR